MQVVFFGACGAEPGRISGNTSFLMRRRGGAGGVLVDASGDPVRHLKQAGVSVHDLDAVVLTHTHTDHIYALPSLFHNIRMAGRTRPLTLIGNAETLDFARDLLDLFGHLGRDDVPKIVWQVAGEGTRVEAGNTAFRFFDAIHSRPCLGFRADGGAAVLIYGSDSAPNPALRRVAAPGCTLIHEATGLDAEAVRLNAIGHSTAGQAGITAREIGAARLILCGLNAETETDCAAYCAEAERAAGIAAFFPETGRLYDL